MRLEEEIKQSKFKSEFQKLAVNIIYTHGWLMNKQSYFFDKYDLTPSQYNILRILRGQFPNPISVNLLKDRMLDKMSDTSRLVERLRKKDLVNRKICKNDRRKADVIISEKGLNLLKEIDHLDDYFTHLFKNINEEEAAGINEILDKIRG